MSDRRTFLRQSGLICAAGMLGVLALDSCKTVKTVTAGKAEKGKLAVPRSDFEFEEKGVKKEYDFIIVRHETLPYTVALYKTANGFSALKMVCTHNQCDLNAHKTNLVCPCHGSEFDTTGKVLTGPASVNLVAYKTELLNDWIWILL